MARGNRNARLIGAVQRMLDVDERIVARGRCWSATRRARVPLLFLGRHQYDVVLTDRRLMLFARRRHRLRPDDVALVKRFRALTLAAEHRRFPLLQHRIRTDTGREVVLEWRPRYHDLGHSFADAVTERAEPAS